MKKPSWRKTKKIIARAISRFKEADPIVYSAAIAFFTIFSLPPTLLIILWVAGGIIDPETIREEVYHQFTHAVGEEGAEQVEMLLNQGRQLSDDILANIITIAVLLFAATVMFTFLKKGLNSIWGVKPRPHKGVIKFIIDRLMSLLLILLMGAMIVVSLLADTLLGYLSKELSDLLFGMGKEVMWIMNVIISYALITGAFVLVYKYLPDVKLPWKPVWIGAMITAALIFLGNYSISTIINKTDVGTTYGAAGSLAAILLWVFYSTVIILLGALFSKIHLLYSGHTIRPTKNAIAVETKEVERKELDN